MVFKFGLIGAGLLNVAYAAALTTEMQSLTTAGHGSSSALTPRLRDSNGSGLREGVRVRFHIARINM